MISMQILILVSNDIRIHSGHITQRGASFPVKCEAHFYPYNLGGHLGGPLLLLRSNRFRKGNPNFYVFLLWERWRSDRQIDFLEIGIGSWKSQDHSFFHSLNICLCWPYYTFHYSFSTCDQGNPINDTCSSTQTVLRLSPDSSISSSY